MTKRPYTVVSQEEVGRKVVEISAKSENFQNILMDSFTALYFSFVAL